MSVVRLDVAFDGATARLLAVAQGAQLEGALPTASAKQLVNLAKAARAYGVAHEYELARAAIAAIQATLTGENEYPVLAKALNKHCQRVIATIKFNEKVGN